MEDYEHTKTMSERTMEEDVESPMWRQPTKSLEEHKNNPHTPDLEHPLGSDKDIIWVDPYDEWREGRKYGLIYW